MTDLSRASAFMPTIKCSNCGNQVEISMMGEHVCGDAGEPTPSEPVPPIPDLLGGAFSSLTKNVFDKFTRTPPAVDTSAANRAFSKQDQLTPISASTGSQALSPKTPVNGRPSVGAAADDYFTPAIAGSPRRPGGYGGFSAEPDSYDGDSTYGTSPGKQGSSLLTRMNSIAPGPFDARSRGRRNAFPVRNSSKDEVTDSNDDLLRLGSSLERSRTATSVSSTGRNMAPPKMPRKDGYGGFGPPQAEREESEPRPFGGLTKRSDTFPNQLIKAEDDELRVESPARMPSAPGPRPDRFRRPSNQNEERPVMTSERSQRPSFKDTSRPPPPRKSLIKPPTRNGSQNLSVNLADEFGVGNPYHSPSMSQSSSNSGYSNGSQPSQPSSATSPARSVTRRPSDTTAFDSLMDDLQDSIDNMQPISLAANAIPIPPRKDNPAPAPPRRGPLQNLRVDPAVQPGRATRLESPISPSPVEPGSAPNFSHLDPALQEPLGRMRSQTTSTMNSTMQRRPSQTPRASRGNCKACSEPITGKSIASADGRLTGRYHKACFVCTTCQEPFASTSFYVHGDRPYCERHYHAVNGSLCGSCDKGIEGQYLEDETAQKYHPACFRCGDCGVVLRDGYFDVAGRPYCEKDASRRLQPQQQQQPMRPPPPRGSSFSNGSGQGRDQRPSVSSQGGLGGGPAPADGGIPSIREPPRGGLPSGPSSSLSRPFGLPTGNRLMPGQALGRGGLRTMPKMEKRMTRLGM
ncbi:hypothetical protein F5Y16DRAFT_378899, partial [Xylariaceae sp. FL0255]